MPRLLYLALVALLPPMAVEWMIAGLNRAPVDFHITLFGLWIALVALIAYEVQK